MEYKGFFASLFDLSFTEFVTTKVIKLIFIIAIIASGIGALLLLIGGISSGVAEALLAIILAPIAFFVYVLLARIWLEVIIVLFRIADNTGRLVEQGADKNAQSANE